MGPIIALALAIEIDAAQFEPGRHLAARAGLTPEEYSTGGNQRMGRISRAGNGRTEDPGNPRHSMALEVEVLFLSGSRNPSGPAVIAPRQQTGHMIAVDPHVGFLVNAFELRGRPHMIVGAHYRDNARRPHRVHQSDELHASGVSVRGFLSRWRRQLR